MDAFYLVCVCTELTLLIVVLGCGRLISHASFTRDAVIYVFENALYVTERHERRGASCEA